MQYLLNGLATGAEYALLGVGFALIYSSTRVYNFLYGALFTLAAYVVVFASKHHDLTLLLAIISGVAVAGIASGLGDRLLFAPLRRRDAATLVVMLTSIGGYVLIENLIGLYFGEMAYGFHHEWIERRFDLLGGVLTGGQLALIAVSFTYCLGVLTVVYRTDLGLTLRAVADDEELARTVGIDGSRLIFFASLIAGVAAGAAGILVGLNTAVRPGMGFRPLLFAMIAAMIGGSHHIERVLVAGMSLGILMHLVIWTLSSRWQDPIAFGLLAVFLLLRGRSH